MLREGMGSVSVWQHLGGGGGVQGPYIPSTSCPVLGMRGHGDGVGIEWD